MPYIVTHTERCPTEDGTDITTGHVILGNEYQEVLDYLDLCYVNWQVPIVTTIVWVEDDLPIQSVRGSSA